MNGGSSRVGGRLLCAVIGLAFFLACGATRAGTITYQYDATGRMVSAAYGADATCQSFTYDSAGNRMRYSSTAAGPPVAVNDAVTTSANTPVTFDPRLNDSSPSCYPLTVTSVTTPSHGTASVVTGGTGVTYTPTTGYVGADSFGYSISDGHSGTASATVSVTVNAALTATITGGLVSASGASGSHTFGANTVVVTGGSGSFTYLWSETDDGNGTWNSGGTGTSFAPSVSGVPGGSESSTAHYTCTVTDTVYHINTTSNVASYRWTNSSQ